MTSDDLRTHVTAYFSARRERLYAEEEEVVADAMRRADEADDARLAMHLLGNLGQREMVYREALSELAGALAWVTEASSSTIACWCGASATAPDPRQTHSIQCYKAQDALRLARAVLGRPDTYVAARGVVPVPPGAPSPEEAIRRGRGDDAEARS